MLDQVRNLGSSLNPMSRLPSIGMIRGFGRNVAATPAAKEIPLVKEEDGGDLTSVSSRACHISCIPLLILSY